MKQVKVFHGDSINKIESDQAVNNFIKSNPNYEILDIQFSENPYGAHIMLVFEDGKK